MKLKLRYCPGYTPHRRRCGSLTTHTLCNRCRLEESRDALAKYVEVQRECAARRGEGGGE